MKALRIDKNSDIVSRFWSSGLWYQVVSYVVTNTSTDPVVSMHYGHGGIRNHLADFTVP
jgi:hypothetical protein